MPADRARGPDGTRRRLAAAFGWTILAGGVGLLGSAFFSSVLHLHRAEFVLAHAVLVGAFTIAYLRWAGIDPVRQLRHHWLRGLLGGLLFGAILFRGVVAQPAPAAPRDGQLAMGLAWFGLVYGAVDALLLSVVPVLSIYSARSREPFKHPLQHLGWAVTSLAGSLFVTALYHLGFAEFRGPALVQPLVGNAIITVSYLVTGSPLAPIVSHVIMHGAAVLQGVNTTVQLPPHY